jgi:glycosyltransferase involved in cell wall biosynthesis
MSDPSSQRSASAAAARYSLVIPVYRNEESLPDLLAVLEKLDRDLAGELEVVLVIDGSPDRCEALLRDQLPKCHFRSQLLVLSRNFGSFAAVRAGLCEARGDYFAVMAADLQEPPELVLDFFRALEREPIDVVLGVRESRNDPLLSRAASAAFWALYRRFVQPEMPPGGIDVFGCNTAFRDHLVALDESNSTLVGLLLWLGFRRRTIGYERLERRHGKSAWAWTRKVTYMLDSVFAFSDLPIRVLTLAGIAGMAVSSGFSLLVLALRLAGLITVPGYAATVLLIAFFAALNSFGLGIIGSYVWRAFENTKSRPHSIVMARSSFGEDET